jgi:hypothetical protein
MVEERTWDLQFPCKADEFSNRIIERSFRKSPEAGRLKGER